MAHTHHKPDGRLSTLIEGPAVPLLTTAEAKAHMRVDFTEDDTLIDSYIAAATDLLDAQWGELGLALLAQTWQVTLPVWSGRVYFPVTPVQQVLSITYYDSDNTQQTLAPEVYRLITDTDVAYMEMLDDQSFPATYARPDAIAIRYEAGFGDVATAVPPGIRQAAKLIVAHWYENREAAQEKSLEAMPLGVRTLLHKYRIPRGFF